MSEQRAGNQYFHQSPRAGELFEGGGHSPGGVPLDFDLWVPSESAGHRGKTYPLVIYLHGRGQRKKKWDGVRGLVTDSPTFRDEFIVLVPKCPKNYYWFHPDSYEGYNNEVSLDLLYAFRRLIDEVKAICAVDERRITLVGVSMGGFGALTYLQHCGDFITSVALLGAHFDGTLDEKFINSVYENGIEMETFDAIIKNCKELHIRMWMLHGTEDKTCSYTDMLVFFHYCQMQGYNDVGLQIDGFDKPLKSHTGPYDWMFDEDRSKYSPNPLGAFCAYPYNYDDSKDFLPKATSLEKQPTTRKCTSSSVSASDLRASQESVHAYDAYFPALSGSTHGYGGEKIRSSSNLSTEPPPSWSHIPAATAPPPPVIVPTYEETFPALNSSNDACAGERSRRSSILSTKARLPPPRSSNVMPAPAPPPVSIMLTHQELFPPLSSSNDACAAERSRRSSNFSTKARLPPARSSNVLPAPAPPPASTMLTYEESFPPLGVSSGVCVRPPPRTTYIPPPPVDSIPPYDHKPSEDHCPGKPIPPSCSTVSSLRTTANTLPPCTSDPMPAYLDDPAADSDAACLPSHQESSVPLCLPPPRFETPLNDNVPSVSRGSPSSVTNEGARAVQNASWKQKRSRSRRATYGAVCADRRAKDKGWRGNYEWDHDWSYYNGEHKGEKDKWNYDCSYYHEEHKERGGRRTYSWGNDWKYHDEEQKGPGERDHDKGESDWKYYDGQERRRENNTNGYNNWNTTSDGEWNGQREKYDRGGQWEYYDGQYKNRGERYTWKSKWE